MEECSWVFAGVADPRRSTAPRHSRPELLLLAWLSPWCGGEGCAAMERFGRATAGLLRRFLSVKPGSPSHAAVSDLFTALDPDSLQKVLLRLLKDWASVLDGDVIAIAGKSLRRSFAAAAALAGASGAGLRRRSPPGARPGDGR